MARLSLVLLHLPTKGKDCVSKSLANTLDYAQTMQQTLKIKQEGVNASGLRNKAERARYAASEISRRGKARIKELTQAHGEAVSPSTEKYLYDTLTVPDLASIEASFDRSRLLLELGPDMAALGLDAADTIQASNSLEKMVAHELAALHKTGMQLFSDTCCDDAAYRLRRLKVGTGCMRTYQEGC